MKMEWQSGMVAIFFVPNNRNNKTFHKSCTTNLGLIFRPLYFIGGKNLAQNTSC